MNQRTSEFYSVFDDRSPIYRQIADQIRRDVITGALADDDQVMSTNQYATFHRINPATAAKAFQELVDEGLLYKRRGVGMFVAPGSAARLRAEHRADFATRMVTPLVDEARRLELSLDDVLDAVRAEFSRTGTGLDAAHTSASTARTRRSTR